MNKLVPLASVVTATWCQVSSLMVAVEVARMSEEPPALTAQVKFPFSTHNDAKLLVAPSLMSKMVEKSDEESLTHVEIVPAVRFAKLPTFADRST